MSFKQQEARRQRRARQPDNVLRALAEQRTQNTPVVRRMVAGTENDQHPMGIAQIVDPVVWAVVCTEAVMAERSFTAAMARYELIEQAHKDGDARTCPNQHHLEMVRWSATNDSNTKTYREWLLS